MGNIEKDLIEAIYAAALEREQWSQVLLQIGDALGGASGIIGLQKIPWGVAWEQTARLDPDLTALFRARYAHPETNVIVRALSQIAVGEPLPVEAVLPIKQLKQTEIFHDLFKPQDLLYSINLLLIRRPAYAAVLGLMRSPGQGPYAPEELAFLRRLAPHLSRALQIDRRLEAIHIQRAGREALLGQLDTAAILLDGRSRLLFANAAAEKIFIRGDGLRVRDRRLVAVHRGSQSALEQALIAAIEHYRGLEIAAPMTVLLPRSSGGRPYALLIAPYPRRSPRLIEAGSHAAVIGFFSDPEAAFQPPAEVLQMLYGLTPREARLAAVLATGRPLREAAEVLHITLNTARTQAKAVYAKTSTAGQAALVRRCLAFVGGGALRDRGR